MAILSTVVGVLNGTASRLLTKYVAALVILLVGFIVARLIGIISTIVLRELNINRIVKRYLGLGISLEEILSTVFVYTAYFFTIVMALDQIELTTKLFDMVSIAVIIVIAISIGIALKDFIPNLIAGFYLLHVGHVKPGDRVKIDNSEGRIVELHLLESRIETKEKDTLLVPNSTMIKKIIRVEKLHTLQK